jgi:AraC-like DNA-binding protein
MTFSAPDIVSFIVIFLFWLLTAFLLSHRAGFRAGNRLLAAFLVSKTLCFLHGMLMRFADRLAPLYPHAYYWGISFEFLLGPSLYLYTRALTQGGFHARRRELLHLVPFLAHVGYMTARFHRLPAAAKVAWLRAGGLGGFEQQAIDTAIFLHFLVYGMLALRLVARHRRRVKDVYAEIQGRRLVWLSSLLVYFLVIWLVSFVNVVWQNLHGPAPLVPWFVFDLLLLSFASMIVFFALRQPELFSVPEPLEPRREARPRLAPADRDRLLARVTTVMEEQKPFLNPEITLTDLSRSTGVAARDLSYLLRDALGTCFYDYINRHRVEEAKRLLAQGEDATSVLEVLQRAGFNSKSVFNTAFKRHTGLTPTEFRRGQPLAS